MTTLTHGHSVRQPDGRHIRTPEYISWMTMKQRCTNPNHHKYHYYGGRGITVCAQWLHSFETFLADMGPKPSRKHSIDRFPNSAGNYEPGNCRWATATEQNRNRGEYSKRKSWEAAEVWGVTPQAASARLWRERQKDGTCK